MSSTDQANEPAEGQELVPALCPRALECPECRAAVIAQPKGYLVSGTYDGIPVVRWTLYECEGHHPILTSESSWDDEWNPATEQLNYAFFDDPYREFPPQERQLSSEIPEELRRIHSEARACLRVKAYTAAAVMSGQGDPQSRYPRSTQGWSEVA